MVMTGEVKVLADNLGDILKSIQEVATASVLVGIPDDKSKRKPKPGKKQPKITNAQLLHNHTHGIRKKPMRQEMAKTMRTKPYSEAYEMYIQEHGSPLWHAPPRPVIEPAIENSAKDLQALMDDAAAEGIAGNHAAFYRKLRVVGMEAQNRARAWFEDLKNNWEPNKPSTIKGKSKGKKISDKPLIDTAQLRRSITYVVKKGGS